MENDPYFGADFSEAELAEDVKNARDMLKADPIFVRLRELRGIRGERDLTDDERKEYDELLRPEREQMEKFTMPDGSYIVFDGGPSDEEPTREELLTQWREMKERSQRIRRELGMRPYPDEPSGDES